MCVCETICVSIRILYKYLQDSLTSSPHIVSKTFIRWPLHFLCNGYQRLHPNLTLEVRCLLVALSRWNQQLDFCSREWSQYTCVLWYSFTHHALHGCQSCHVTSSTPAYLNWWLFVCFAGRENRLKHNSSFMSRLSTRRKDRGHPPSANRSLSSDPGDDDISRCL